MIVDAVILAGGRSRRLGGEPKSDLVVEGRTLLDRTVDSARGCRSIVVVGDPRAGLRTVRETPPFGGPVAALAAALELLESDGAPAEWTLLLACDMPHIEAAVPLLLASAHDDGAIAVDSTGRDQYLAGVYRTHSLRAALGPPSEWPGRSMGSLISGLRLNRIPAGDATDDVDTPDDARRHGAVRQEQHLE